MVGGYQIIDFSDYTISPEAVSTIHDGDLYKQMLNIDKIPLVKFKIGLGESLFTYIKAFGIVFENNEQIMIGVNTGNSLVRFETKPDGSITAVFD